MMVKAEHQKFVVDNLGKMSTKTMREILMGKLLTKTQANNCIRNQKVKAGVYKNASVDSTHDFFKGKKHGKWQFKGGNLFVAKKKEKVTI